MLRICKQFGKGSLQFYFKAVSISTLNLELNIDLQNAGAYQLIWFGEAKQPVRNLRMEERGRVVRTEIFP